VAAEQCEIHPFEGADDRCGACGRTYCIECIVYPFGPRKPPMCKSCAISASGIRKHANRAPVASRRQLKQEARARRKRAKAKDNRPAEQAPSVSATAPPTAAPPPIAPPPNGRSRKSAQTAGVVAGLGVASDESNASPAYRSDLTPI